MTKCENVYIIMLYEKRGIMRKFYDYSEWQEIVYPILTSKEYFKRRTFRHHGDITVYDHCVHVSRLSYRIAKKLHLDYKSAAIAGLLHDLYTTPWQEVTVKKPFFEQHGFTHARDALKNSRKFYKKYLNPKIENAILRHMFPLNITPPKYATGYIVTLADKIVSLEVFTEPEVIIKTFGFLKRN